VFVATRKGEVHAVTLEDGRKRGAKGFGQSIEGSPLIHGTTLFVPSAWGRPFLTAYDMTGGDKLWTWREVAIESSLLLHDGVLVAADVEGRVHAFDPETGDVVWTYSPDSVDTIIAGAVAPVQGRVVVSSTSGIVTCLYTDDGSTAWTTNVGGPVYATPAADSTRVYVPTTNGRLWALDRDSGEHLWSYPASDSLVRFTSPAVNRGHLFFGGTDGLMRAIVASDGSTIWTFQTDGTFSAPPAVQGDLVFAGATDRRFFALDRDSGSLEWNVELRGRIKSAPAVFDGYVVIMSEPRYVYAFAEYGRLNSD
jgi:outer membrane protein assembly factor BamB